MTNGSNQLLSPKPMKIIPEKRFSGNICNKWIEYCEGGNLDEMGTGLWDRGSMLLVVYKLDPISQWLAALCPPISFRTWFSLSLKTVPYSHL